MAKGKCDRYANQQLRARDLWLMHIWELPSPLQGDFRSAKSNIMRAHTPPTDPTCRKQAQRNKSVLGKDPINPNRGVGFNHHKMLGLDCMWSTTLRIERYVQHAHLKQHLLVFPGCAPVAAGQRTGGTPSKTYHTDSTSACYAAATKRNHKLPLGRITKLYLPLCTEREIEDAQLAHLRLKTHLYPNRSLPQLWCNSSSATASCLSHESCDADNVLACATAM